MTLDSTAERRPGPHSNRLLPNRSHRKSCSHFDLIERQKQTRAWETVVMVAVVVAADVLADMGDAEYYEMKSRGTSDDRR